MTLLLIRHGETPLNVARVLQPPGTPLSERGVAQAHALARRLAQRGGIGAVLSSDLPRARHTAEIVAAAVGAPISSTALLQERDFGEWRGRAYDTLPHDPLTMDAAPPGGESAAAFAARVAEAFALIVERAQRTPGLLAVVTHGLLIRALIAAHARIDSSLALPAHLGNTSICVIGSAAPHVATLLNCTRHLEADGGRYADDTRALSGG